ncbi:MAG: hypothetical protein U1E20_03880 [Methylocystis sp.]|uniref:hypothetical protein n=1 Tax=Methylocystis sp. TaxID=1911079 RepID=UPI00393BC175
MFEDKSIVIEICDRLFQRISVLHKRQIAVYFPWQRQIQVVVFLIEEARMLAD